MTISSDGETESYTPSNLDQRPLDDAPCWTPPIGQMRPSGRVLLLSTRWTKVPSFLRHLIRGWTSAGRGGRGEREGKRGEGWDGIGEGGKMARAM